MQIALGTWKMKLGSHPNLFSIPICSSFYMYIFYHIAFLSIQLFEKK